MGTDITLHIEVRDEVLKKWHHYAAPDIERHYEVFQKMAGIFGCERCNDGIVSRDRGMPSDATVVTCRDWISRGKPEVTWLSSHQVDELRRWYQDTFAGRFFETDFLRCYYFGHFWEVANLGDECHRMDDFRFVFWFCR